MAWSQSTRLGEELALAMAKHLVRDPEQLSDPRQVACTLVGLLSALHIKLNELETRTAQVEVTARA